MKYGIFCDLVFHFYTTVVNTNHTLPLLKCCKCFQPIYFACLAFECGVSVYTSSRVFHHKPTENFDFWICLFDRDRLSIRLLYIPPVIPVVECWLITHIFPPPARAVKGKRNVLVSLSTLSNQNRELYKEVVLSVRECAESRTLLLASSLVIIHNIHIKMKTQIQFKAYSLKGLIKHYQTFWCEMNLLIVHNSLRRNWGWMNSVIQKNNKSPWSLGWQQ